MRWILPVLLAIMGLVGGGAAGYFLHPKEDASPACEGESCAKSASAENHDSGEPAEAAKAPEYVKLNNQFIVPDLKNGAISSLIVLSLSIETAPGGTEKVFDAEPKLRDVFLQILFDHANAGGFRGDFTTADRMDDLRRALLEAARGVLGDDVSGVLISDIVRQDMS